MAAAKKKAATKVSPKPESEALEQQQQVDIQYSPEYLTAEDALAQAEQEMSQLEVT
jgi:hypothetical protein